MGLTLSKCPLATSPAAANYRIEGPEHRLFFGDFPRRVRARFAGKTVFDTRHGKFLHETGLLPQLYVPRADVRLNLLERTSHVTRCPFKGQAAYWTVRVDKRLAEDAAWAYPDPVTDAAWLAGYLAFYWDSMDSWFDEDEQVHGHLRDPFHRVDVRASTRHVCVTADGETIAATRHPQVLSETGLPNRYYIPRDDVRCELLEPSNTHSICPYKGTASYWTLRLGNRRIEDVAWFYPEPLEDAIKVRDHLCFLANGVKVAADGERVA